MLVHLKSLQFIFLILVWPQYNLKNFYMVPYDVEALKFNK